MKDEDQRQGRWSGRLNERGTLPRCGAPMTWEGTDKMSTSSKLPNVTFSAEQLGQTPYNMAYLLAINCGSSSIKGKLYAIPSSYSQQLKTEATLGVSNIGAKNEKVQIKVKWSDGQAKDVSEEGDDGDEVDCEGTLWAANLTLVNR